MDAYPLLQQATLLIVEDDALVREALIAMFDEVGSRVVSASDAEEGVTQAQQHRPDIVICDIGLPGMDGYYFVQCLREHELSYGLKPALAVALTGAVSDIAQMRSVAEGFDHFVAKPVNPAALFDLLCAALRKRA